MAGAHTFAEVEAIAVEDEVLRDNGKAGTAKHSVALTGVAADPPRNRGAYAWSREPGRASHRLVSLIVVWAPSLRGLRSCQPESQEGNVPRHMPRPRADGSRRALRHTGRSRQEPGVSWDARPSHGHHTEDHYKSRSTRGQTGDARSPTQSDRPSEWTGGDGLSSSCGACHAAATRKWRAANPEAVAAYNWGRRLRHTPRPCVGCGALFVPPRRDSVRCSSCREGCEQLDRLRRRLLRQPHGFEGLVWLVEPLEAHCFPLADGPDGAVPALDLSGACAPVSPHCRYHDDTVVGIDEPLNVIRRSLIVSSSSSVMDRKEPRCPFGFPVQGHRLG